MLPDTYSALYPGRFLKADLLKGKHVTLTIKNIDVEELIGEKNKAEPKVVVSFLERPLEYVMPKTNGFCLKRMFGNDPHEWIGKRITIYPTKTKFGREDVDCIRVAGSPDIPEDMPITVPQGRKKAWETVMKKTAMRNGAEPAKNPEPAPQQNFVVNERLSQIFALLGWNAATQQNWLVANVNLNADQMIAKLEPQLNQD
jgi:hypothetical protein